MINETDVMSMLRTLRLGGNQNARAYIDKCLKIGMDYLPQPNEHEQKLMILYKSPNGTFKQKIEAIKSIRTRTSCQLKAASDALEHWYINR